MIRNFTILEILYIGAYDSMSTKIKTLIFLIVLCLVDVVIPVPILGLILIYALFRRPSWFKDVVTEIYDS